GGTGRRRTPDWEDSRRPWRPQRPGRPTRGCPDGPGWRESSGTIRRRRTSRRRPAGTGTRNPEGNAENPRAMPWTVPTPLLWTNLTVAPAAVNQPPSCTDDGSTFTPGPIVEVTAMRCTKVPLAPDGLAFWTASMKALMFSTSFSAGNEALPTPAWTIPAFSTRNSTAPPLASLTALVMSMVTVPTLG